VNGKQWDANPTIQKFKQSQKIKDNAGLQAYFNQRLLKIVTAHGKTMMGWDEILAPEIPKSVVIQSWRGQQSLADAARQGYRGLLSNGYYIDLMYPASQHYAADPLSGPAASLTAEEKQRVLGGEATMWTEYVAAENLDSRIWPRTAAIAERLWSPQEVTDRQVRDVGSMYRRLKVISTQLDSLGLTTIPSTFATWNGYPVAPTLKLSKSWPTSSSPSKSTPANRPLPTRPLASPR